jgi:nucleoside-diphosphate-sugar epimerase
MIQKTISILGCGWLGLPLGKALLVAGCRVKGSVTQIGKLETIKQNGIEPYLVHFDPGPNTGLDNSFFETDILFVNIPPGRKQLDANNYISIVENIIDCVKRYKIPQVMFISSTSVYPDTGGKADEGSTLPPMKESGKTLLHCENLFQSEKSFGTVILRFGGLIGGDRHPGRFLAQKQQVNGGQSPVNLIHLDDCIGIVQTLIRNNIKNGTYNACMPKHPTKKEFYSKAAQKLSLPMPFFNENEKEGFKMVDSSKIVNETGYAFKYNDPLECI